MGRILLLGPERDRAGGLRTLLRQDGHEIFWQRTVEDWAAAELRVVPEIVVAAVGPIDDVLTRRRRCRRGFPAPVLFIQRDSDVRDSVLVEDRLIDRMTSPFMSEELLARVDALVRVRRVILRSAIGPPPEREAPEDAETGDPSPPAAWKRLATRVAAVLGSRVPRLQKPVGPYLEVASRIAEWADSRDGFDPGHAERVANLCGLMADGLGLGDGEASALVRAAILHDIGKVALPVELLRRRGPLDEHEMRMMRTHADRGARLLGALDDETDIEEAIRYHHERADGSGYYGKRLEETPRAARILAVAEDYDGMTHSRVRESLAQDDALRRLEADAGSAYDPACVEALTRAIRPRAFLPVSGLLGN